MNEPITDPHEPTGPDCPPEEDLVAFVDGRLTGGDSAALASLEDHLSVCGDCRTVASLLIRETDSVDEESVQAPSFERAPSLGEGSHGHDHKPHVPIPLLVAAGLMLVLVANHWLVGALQNDLPFGEMRKVPPSLENVDLGPAGIAKPLVVLSPRGRMERVPVAVVLTAAHLVKDREIRLVDASGQVLMSWRIESM
ncbi:MAG: hypothetical protein ACYTG4_09295, partial [Planctomycetota bacterium]